MKYCFGVWSVNYGEYLLLTINRASIHCCISREFFLPSIDLPMDEPDHPKTLLADIDASFVSELPSMHCKFFSVHNIVVFTLFQGAMPKCC
jgi:hypothetical protein